MSIDPNELMKLAIETNNQELLEFAKSKIEKKKMSSRILDVDQFRNVNNNNKTKRGTPVKGSLNVWSDDGITEKNEQNVTPNYVPARRNREKYSEVEAVCEECKNTVKINKLHLREVFICPNCIEEKVKKNGRVR